MTELRFAFTLEERSLEFMAAKLVAIGLLLALAWSRRRRVPRWDAVCGLAAAVLGFNLLLDLGRVGLSYNHPGLTGVSELAPLFAFLSPSFEWPVLLHVGLASGFLLIALPRLCKADLSDTAFAGVTFAAALVLPATAAFSSPAEQVYLQFFHSGRDYLHHAPALSSLGPFLSGYVDSMPDLSIHARTHGPASLLLLAVLRDGVGGNVHALAIAIAALGALLPLLCWRIAVPMVGETSARVAALLLLFSPAFHHFSFVSMDAIFALVMLSALALWLRVLFSAGATLGLAFACGSAFYVAACFSFSTAVVGLIAVATAWFGVRRELIPLRRLRHAVAAAAAGFAICWAGVWGVSGFDLLDCFRSALAQNSSEMGSAWRSLSHYSLAATGNLAAFALGCGLPLAALALRGSAQWRERTPAGSTAMALATALTIVTIAGLYQWEVERIWLFAVPLVAIAAAPEVARSGFSSAGALRALLAAQWAHALLSEVAFDTYW